MLSGRRFDSRRQGPQGRPLQTLDGADRPGCSGGVGGEAGELGLCGGQRVGVVEVGACAEATTLHETRDPGGDALDDATLVIIMGEAAP